MSVARDVRQVYTDLYDAAFTPRETILYLTVTSNNITVRLLGASDRGGYTPIPNATIHIYELDTTWNPIGDYVTDQNGLVSINRSNTKEWYKAVFDGTEEYRPAVAYAQLQAQPPAQPPSGQQPQAQQIVAPCASWLWLLLLILALMSKRKEGATEV